MWGGGTNARGLVSGNPASSRGKEGRGSGGGSSKLAYGFSYSGFLLEGGGGDKLVVEEWCGGGGGGGSTFWTFWLPPAHSVHVFASRCASVNPWGFRFISLHRPPDDTPADQPWLRLCPCT